MSGCCSVRSSCLQSLFGGFSDLLFPSVTTPPRGCLIWKSVFQADVDEEWKGEALTSPSLPTLSIVCPVITVSSVCQTHRRGAGVSVGRRRGESPHPDPLVTRISATLARHTQASPHVGARRHLKHSTYSAHGAKQQLEFFCCNHQLRDRYYAGLHLYVAVSHRAAYHIPFPLRPFTSS